MGVVIFLLLVLIVGVYFIIHWFKDFRTDLLIKKNKADYFKSRAEYYKSLTEQHKKK